MLILHTFHFWSCHPIEIKLRIDKISQLIISDNTACAAVRSIITRASLIKQSFIISWWPLNWFWLWWRHHKRIQKSKWKCICYILCWVEQFWTVIFDTIDTIEMTIGWTKQSKTSCGSDYGTDTTTTWSFFSLSDYNNTKISLLTPMTHGPWVINWQWVIPILTVPHCTLSLWKRVWIMNFNHVRIF